ncbi:unnamed protein product [Nesidiocoris tenuis]|uniref:Uncharacterized protein n=1 Tax=Nesidiocoris tenuis TaxID=355587 RepID=A0A6H5FUP9_9HEMI|nr:unnamed protein product [Nesidiocoris tenuis]
MFYNLGAVKRQILCGRFGMRFPRQLRAKGEQRILLIDGLIAVVIVKTVPIKEEIPEETTERVVRPWVLGVAETNISVQENRKNHNSITGGAEHDPFWSTGVFTCRYAFVSTMVPHAIGPVSMARSIPAWQMRSSHVLSK